MALWKIAVKNSGIINGVRIEKGMSIEYVTKTTTPPLQSLSQHKEAITNYSRTNTVLILVRLE